MFHRLILNIRPEIEGKFRILASYMFQAENEP